MTRRSPFEFDISVSADKKRRARSRGSSGAVESSARACSHPNCQAVGKFRAPKSPDQLDDFLWFCLEHVRQYNLKWNFFENQSEAELEAQFAADKVWERPTKPMRTGVKGHPEGEAWRRFGFDDPATFLGDKATMNPAQAKDQKRRTARRLPPTETKALAILDARDYQTKTEIRAQYKALVKALHPDMNSGKRDDEDQLAEVVWAWEQIKGSRSFTD